MLRFFPFPNYQAGWTVPWLTRTWLLLCINWTFDLNASSALAVHLVNMNLMWQYTGNVMTVSPCSSSEQMSSVSLTGSRCGSGRFFMLVLTFHTQRLPVWVNAAHTIYTLATATAHCTALPLFSVQHSFRYSGLYWFPDHHHTTYLPNIIQHSLPHRRDDAAARLRLHTAPHAAARARFLPPCILWFGVVGRTPTGYYLPPHPQPHAAHTHAHLRPRTHAHTAAVGVVYIPHTHYVLHHTTHYPTTTCPSSGPLPTCPMLPIDPMPPPTYLPYTLPHYYTFALPSLSG